MKKEYYVDIYDDKNGLVLFEIDNLTLKQAEKVFDRIDMINFKGEMISCTLYECREEENIVLKIKWFS